jgi:hypothetical protein
VSSIETYHSPDSLQATGYESKQAIANWIAVRCYDFPFLVSSTEWHVNQFSNHINPAEPVITVCRWMRNNMNEGGFTGVNYIDIHSWRTGVISHNIMQLGQL